MQDDDESSYYYEEDTAPLSSCSMPMMGDLTREINIESYSEQLPNWSLPQVSVNSSSVLRAEIKGK